MYIYFILQPPICDYNEITYGEWKVKEGAKIRRKAVINICFVINWYLYVVLFQHLGLPEGSGLCSVQTRPSQDRYCRISWRRRGKGRYILICDQG